MGGVSSTGSASASQGRRCIQAELVCGDFKMQIGVCNCHGRRARTQGVQALEGDEELLHDGADNGRLALLLVHALAHAAQHDGLQAAGEARAQVAL